MSDAILEQAAAQVRATRAGIPVVRAFFDAASCTASYVIHDPATGRAAIIDSVWDYDPDSGRTSSSSADALIAYVQEQGLAVDWLLETHAHADHFSAAPHLQAKLGGTIAIGRHIVHVQQVFGKLFNLGDRFGRDAVYFDRLLEDGDRINVGEIDGIALHVPGHTPVDMAFVIGDAVFTGDTMFMPDYGTARADFPGGDARQLYRSIRRLLSLPDPTRLFLCHDYKAPDRDDYEWETTVGAQRAGNVHVHDGVSEDEFVAMRERRDATLGMPRLMLPAIQVNIRGGRLPVAEENGVRYLKIPLDAL